MRVCILCEESKVEKVRKKMDNKSILVIPCSQTGELPATHRFCSIATDEKGAQKLLDSQELTIMEISEPKDFLAKWNLKIIKS